MNKQKRTINALQIEDGQRYIQSENSKLLYSVNWKALLQDKTLSASAWSAEGASPTITESVTYTAGTGVTAAFINGSANEYRIVNKVTDSDGEIHERFFDIKIKDNSKGAIVYDYPYGGSL